MQHAAHQETIQMRVNQERLIQNLRLTFTNSTTFLNELMQNARRAGATYVDVCFHEETATLTVCDNGCGIAQMQTLVEVASSGWDAKIIEMEHPFGMGWLAAAYAAKAITVSSKGKRISCLTEDLLAFRQVEVTACAHYPGTELILHGIERTDIRGALHKAAKGFPIQVIYNGESLPRPHALDGDLSFVDTGLGQLFTFGMPISREAPVKLHHGLICYLQGLPVYASKSPYSNCFNVIHLDSGRFYARMPDRDKLLDEAEALKEINDLVCQLWKAHVDKAKTDLSPAIFAERYYEAIAHYNIKDVLNDNPYLPSTILEEVMDAPTLLPHGWGSEYLATRKKGVSREEVETSTVKLCTLSGCYDDTIWQWIFAWKTDRLIIEPRRALDKDHWAHCHVQDIEKLTYNIEPLGEVSSENISWGFNSAKLVCCDSYRLTVGDESVIIEDEAMYDAKDDTIYYPIKTDSNDVIGQINSYTDENDGFLENEYDDAQTKFKIQVGLLRGTSLEQTMLELLGELRLRRYPRLLNTKFTLLIDAAGKIDVKAA